MEAEDARHNTPPQGLTASQIYPPSFEDVRTPEAYLRDQLDRDRLHPELAGAVRVVLNRLSAHEVLAPAPTPTPGIVYSDPVGRFECTPATDTFTGEHLSVLELRVLAAHLATALDTVNRELKRRM